jgi:hypothetical protein
MESFARNAIFMFEKVGYVCGFLAYVNESSPFLVRCWSIIKLCFDRNYHHFNIYMRVYGLYVQFVGVLIK